MLVFETIFISEKIEGHMFGALLEISDKFITKLNVLSYIILSFRLYNFVIILYDYKKTHWLGSFARKVIVCAAKVRDENFRNEKRYEYKA